MSSTFYGKSCEVCQSELGHWYIGLKERESYLNVQSYGDICLRCYSKRRYEEICYKGTTRAHLGKKDTVQLLSHLLQSISPGASLLSKLMLVCSQRILSHETVWIVVWLAIETTAALLSATAIAGIVHFAGNVSK